jgi:hypothetical protein
LGVIGLILPPALMFIFLIVSGDKDAIELASYPGCDADSALFGRGVGHGFCEGTANHRRPAVSRLPDLNIWDCLS